MAKAWRRPRMSVALVEARKNEQHPTGSGHFLHSSFCPSPHSLCLFESQNSQHPRTCPCVKKTILPVSNLLEVYQHLTDRGKENTQLKPPLAILSHLKWWQWWGLRSICEAHSLGHRLTIRLRPNHRPIEQLSLPHTYHINKDYLPQFLLPNYIMSSYQQINYKAYY